MKVRTHSPWSVDLRIGDTHFSPDYSVEEADALLCNWGPSEELFTFPRRKAWYSIEPPVQFNGLEGGTWPSIRDRLPPHEFLWYNHPDERFRIPESTHFEPLEVDHRSDRLDRAVAVVSNFGGKSWRRRDRDIAYRNQMILHPWVELFGREGWNRYRKSILSRPNAPKNYKGSLPGDWETSEKRNMLASYKVVICLENAYEPMSFSEKLVEAARAGAVPVYRAHPTVRDAFLDGARWIDPQDYGNDTEQTLSAALDADREEFARANEAWFKESAALASTHHDRIFEKIAQALQEDS